MADGSIIIDTQIDNDGAVKDLKQLKGTVETAGKSFEKAGNRLSQAFGAKQQSKIESLTQKLERQNESIKKQAIIVDELKTKYDKLVSGEAEPKQLKSLQSELAKTEKEYQRLLKENDKFLQDYTKAEEMASFDLASSGKIKPENKQNLEISSAGLEETGNRLEELRHKAEKLKEEIKNIKLNPENSEEAKKIGNEFNLAKDKLSRLKDEASVTERNIQKALSVKKQETQKSVKQVNREMTKTPDIAQGFTKSIERFSNRIKSLVMSALIFNILSASLRNLTQYMGNVLKTNTDFSNSLAQIKGNLLTAFQPIYEAVMPALNTFMKGVASVTAHVAAFFNTLFGKSISQSQKNAQSLYEQANATKKVGKETEKALKPLSNFDEINRLENSKNISSSGTSNTSITPDFNADIDTSTTEKMLERLTVAFQPVIDAIDRLKTAMDPLKNFIWQGLLDFYNLFLVPVGNWILGEGLPRFIDGLTYMAINIDWNTINMSLQTLWSVLTPFAINIGEGLLWFWENVLVPLGTWIMNEAVPVFLDLLSSAINLLNTVIEILKPYGIWLWENFLNPLAEWTGGLIISTLNLISDAFNDISDWISNNQELFMWLLYIVGVLTTALIVYNIAQNASTIAAGLWSVASGIATGVTTAFGAAVAFLTSPITLIIVAIGALIAIIVLLVKNWDTVKETAQKVWEWIKDVWGKFADWFDKKVWQPFMSALKSVGNFFVDVINGMIGGFEGFVNFFIRGINTIINGLNQIQIDIPDWLGGGKFGFNIPKIPELKLGRIPKLAQGAVIPPNREFLAVLGDQKSGVNIEAPLETIVEAFRQVQGNENGNTTVIFEIDKREFAKVVYKLNKQETQRIGLSFAKGGAY